MKDTVMPVQRPTVNSIWNSLKATGKKHIVITGQRGSGKTTLFNKLVSRKYGFTTHALPQDKVILQFHGMVNGDYSYTIGTFESGQGKNRMQPVVDTLDELAEIIENISRAEIIGARLNNSIIGSNLADDIIDNNAVGNAGTSNIYFTIDEIGFLEESSPAFCKAITHIFDRHPVIATVRKQKTGLISSIISRDDVLLIDLDDPFGNVGCVIMASGLGSRFGDNKLMTSLGNKPLIGHAISTTKSLFSKSVVVTRHMAVDDYCHSIHQKVILHDLPHRNDTTRLGTEYLMSQSVDSIIFFQGDQPFVSLDSIMAVLLCAKNIPGKIIRLSFNGDDCSPMLFPACFFDYLTSLPQSKGGNYIAKMYPDEIIRVEARNKIEIIDIDTPEDMERANATTCQLPNKSL